MQLLRLKSHGLADNFYNIYGTSLSSNTISKKDKKSFWNKNFDDQVKMKREYFNVVVFLVHLGFLVHALFIFYNQYLKYEIVTSTSRIKTGRVKELPRISICPYYQMEESLWYHYKKVVYGIDPS